jgi:hypothetical protein
MAATPTPQGTDQRHLAPTALLDDGVRAKVEPGPEGGFLGYAVGTHDLAQPPIEWRGTDTAIQATAVARELGVFDDPDSFYRDCGSNFSGVRGWAFRHVIRPRMNRRVAAIRRDTADGHQRASRGSPG